MSEDWNTKYGPRRVRRDPPTLDEAIFAAVGITDDHEQQAEIAASLMGMPLRRGPRRSEEAEPRQRARNHPRDRGRARRAAFGGGRAARGAQVRQRQADRHVSRSLHCRLSAAGSGRLSGRAPILVQFRKHLPAGAVEAHHRACRVERCVDRKLGQFGLRLRRQIDRARGSRLDGIPGALRTCWRARASPRYSSRW